MKKLPVMLASAALCSAYGLALQAPGQTPAAQNPSHSFAPGACGPADPAYIQTANETGGIPLFLQRSEAVKAMQLVRESTRENVSTVLWVSGTLGLEKREFEIPVDSSTNRITFTFSVDTKGTKLELRTPTGQLIAEGSAHIQDTELNCGRVVTVESPEPGPWHAEITGAGTFWLEAKAQSDIYFISAEFVRQGGRAGHEGLFKIQGPPLAGEPAILEASLSVENTKTSEFVLVSQEGAVLQKLRLDASNSDRSFLDFTGNVDLPAVPFRVAVRGRDSNGNEYQRFYAPLFHAEHVEVTAKLDFDELPPGSTKNAIFVVRNLGPTRTFRVKVTDSRRFVTSVAPTELSLGANQSAEVHVELRVPESAAHRIEDNIVVVASSSSDPVTMNSSVARFEVSTTAAAPPTP